MVGLVRRRLEWDCVGGRSRLYVDAVGVLKKLEEDGVISKKTFNTKPPLRAEYSLTEFGETLIPLLKSISDWGGYVVAHHAEDK